MLTVACLLFAAYGLYSAGLGVAILIGCLALEWWAGAWLVLFGLLLTLAAPLVRVRFPGGLALALGSLLGLQALSVHNDNHFYGQVVPGFQVLRGVFAAAGVLLALGGLARPDVDHPEAGRDDDGGR